MPRTFGDAIIHISHADYAVKVDTQLPQHGGRPPTEVESKIGNLIAENLVDDGATLQMGKYKFVLNFYLKFLIMLLFSVFIYDNFFFAFTLYFVFYLTQN